MTITGRLTLFFLAAVAAVLAAFSAAQYALARTYLYRQLNDRASATLDTLVAAAELEPDGIEWEPKGRTLLLRGDGEPPVWAVFDGAGRRIDGPADPAVPLEPYAAAGADLGQHRSSAVGDGRHWRIVARTLRHPQPENLRSEDGRKRYAALVFVTAWPTDPVRETLWTLSFSLAAVSLAVGLACGVCARRVCRRALAPVTRMTEAADAIRSTESGDRLPVPPARDELRALASAFNGLLTRLDDAHERQRRFTGEASHQLRTPLAAMLGQLEVALRRDRDPDEYRRVLATAVQQAGRLRRIVEMLMFLARADAEAKLPDLEPTDLGAWLRAHTTESWGTHSRKADLTIEVRDGPHSAAVQPALLGQALDNLVDNAFKYSDPGTPVLVRLAAAEGGGAVVTVEDRGRGLSDDDLRDAFEPFYRSPEVRRAGIGGVGLGLAVTARIAAAFGGSVGSQRAQGGGSIFSLRLPAAP